MNRKKKLKTPKTGKAIPSIGIGNSDSYLACSGRDSTGDFTTRSAATVNWDWWTSGGNQAAGCTGQIEKIAFRVLVAGSCASIYATQRYTLSNISILCNKGTIGIRLELTVGLQSNRRALDDVSATCRNAVINDRFYDCHQLTPAVASPIVVGACRCDSASTCTVCLVEPFDILSLDLDVSGVGADVTAIGSGHDLTVGRALPSRNEWTFFGNVSTAGIGRIWLGRWNNGYRLIGNGIHVAFVSKDKIGTGRSSSTDSATVGLVAQLPFQRFSVITGVAAFLSVHRQSVGSAYKVELLSRDDVAAAA